MKLIIAGSRDITDAEFIEACVRDVLKQMPNTPLTEVVSGMARGVDMIGAALAKSWKVPVKPFPVEKEDWERHGKAAGPMRNRAMAKYGDVLCLIWTGDTTGSLSMRNAMRAEKKPTFEYIRRVVNP